MSAPSPMELLSRIAPVSDEQAAAVFGAAGRERLLRAITQVTPRGRSARRRRRRPVVIALAVVVIAAATGSGWALTRGSARETTAVDCLIHGETTVIDSTSGDPAADCAAVWPAPAPRLKAYDNGLGGVVVIPANQKPRPAWTPIASQDVALIELQESLDDNINGLSSACFGSSAATRFVRRELGRLGFVGWTVKMRRTSGTIGQLCYGGFADLQSKSVVLAAGGDQTGPANWPPHRLADSLRPLTSECLSLSAMKNEVVKRATSLGMSQTVENDHNYQLRTVRNNSMRCTSVSESVTGTTYVVLRGPARASP